ILALGLHFIGLAQPAMTNDVIMRWDFDGDESEDLDYLVGASRSSGLTEDWSVFYVLEPYRQTRFLKFDDRRVTFAHGESINAARPVCKTLIPNGPLPPIEFYNLVLLDYRAILREEWEYITITPRFETESDLLLGLKLVVSTGTHYGWIRLIRSVVDKHTAFEIGGYAYHPVPDEPIPAGQPPPLPPIQTQDGPEGLAFSWDSRWGPLVLESTTHLIPPITWEAVVEGAGDPVAISTDDEQRFYRLRQP
ncbi:MAG: hypothetical protein KIS91_14050, partial [Anaerolineae bacterium]|nr:hypothetical protein [Anaerolineae bacterium]